MAETMQRTLLLSGSRRLGLPVRMTSGSSSNPRTRLTLCSRAARSSSGPSSTRWALPKGVSA